MSCNPSFGGVGKGHLIKEIDALDGVCGRICDISGIQYRMLNRKKGPAVWGPRAQIDRDLYRSNMQKEIFSTPNLDVCEASVEDLMTTSENISRDSSATPETKSSFEKAIFRETCDVVVSGGIASKSKGKKTWSASHTASVKASPQGAGKTIVFKPTLKQRLVWKYSAPRVLTKCVGVVLADGTKIHASSVVLTAGTFLRGRINIGLKVREAGRMGDAPAVGLAKTIEDLGFTMGRLRTGTPPRIARSSINFQNMTPWFCDDPSHPFSFENEKVWIEAEDQVLCHTTRTMPELKQAVLDCIHLNKHIIEEVNGPRYCPSIESKVLKFQDQTYMCWIEPEGLNIDEMYLQGFNCTMPEEDQIKCVRLVDGLENAEITRFGYGVEYDFMDPRQVAPTLQTFKVLGLYFAGQINGTTGYEEAAAQGLVAGINAARRVKGLSDFTISRSEGYIGVLIDDLTTLGTNEPYRMFTSRSEFRMSLRPDNADERLTSRGYHDAGCVSKDRHENTENKLGLLKSAIEDLKSVKKTTSKWRAMVGLGPIPSPGGFRSAFEAIGDCHDQECSFDKIMKISSLTRQVQDNYWLFERLKAEALYNNLLPTQQKNIEVLKREENLIIPTSVDYSKMPLKLEIREKLAKARPQNLAAATRIQGVTPAALLHLLTYIKKKEFQLDQPST